MKPKTRSARGRGRATRREPPSPRKVAETISDTLEALNITPKARKQRKIAEKPGEGDRVDKPATVREEITEGETPQGVKKGDWSSADEARLIELWQEEDHLYNKTNPNYRNAQLKSLALDRLATDLNREGK